MLTSEPKNPRKHKFLLVLATVLILTGLYLLAIFLGPVIPSGNVSKAAEAQPMDNRIIIPSANINVPIFEGGAEVMNRGVWHRFPERGDPENGGNFIVTGHRFVFGPSPWYTKQKSTFYNINKIDEGDEIVVHWQGKKYHYRVVKKYRVNPDGTNIEDASQDPKLTLYSCTLGGVYDGREVVEAHPQ